MASIFKRKGKSNWYIQFTDECGVVRQKSSRTTSKRAAERMGQELEHQALRIRDGLDDAVSIDRTRANAIPLDEHIREYLRQCKTLHSPRHIQCKKNHLDKFVEQMKTRRLSDITPERFIRLVEQLQATDTSPRTINTYRASLKAFCKWCVDSGKMSKNPLASVKPLKEDPVNPRRALTSEEIRQILSTVETLERRVFYFTALYAGLRRGELVRLKWGDVDWESNILKLLKTKAGKKQEISLHGDLVAALSMLFDEVGNPKPSLLVFPDAPSNEERRKDFERAGVHHIDEFGRRVDLHSFRRTLGTMLARAGVSPKDAQRVLRHAAFVTTMEHYVDAEQDSGASALARLPQIEFSGVQQYVQQNRHGSASTQCNPMREGGSLIAGRSIAQAESTTGLCDPVRDLASKRVDGLEPTTFSLEG
jgi:integrase